MKRLLLQSLAIPAIQILFDLLVRSLWVSKGGSKRDAGVFAAGLLACWALSFAFVATASLFRRWGAGPAAVVSGLLALLHTVLLATNFFLFRFFGEYLFPGAIAFLTDTDYMGDYIRTFAGFASVASLLLVWGLFFLCLLPWKKSGSHPLAVAAAAVLVLAAGIAALRANEKKSEYRMPPDVVAVESLSKHFLRVRDKVWPLHPSERLPVRAGRGLARPPTVLVIVHESMGTRSLPFMEGYRARVPGQDGEGGMPRLARRMRRDSAAFAVFQRAYANAVATQVSMSSMFSGVSPEESHRKLHCMPMFWDMARAAGYKTAYFSSQRLRWATLSDFLLNQPLDSLVAREQTDHPPVNDMGIDDFHVVETLEAWLASHPGEPLFVVWNTNALHVPFQAESRFVDLARVPGDRYEKALYLLDTAMERVFQALEKTGRLEDALILNTSDHGEDPDPVHPVARIKSYYDEYTRIPLWVRLPPSLRGGASERALRARARLPVSNVDIAPSLARLWGLEPAGSAGKAFAPECSVADGRIPWRGESLFDGAPRADRVITILSTNDIRLWEGEGFGLVRGPWRVVLWPDSGRGLYNIDADPGQLRNVWNDAADSVMEPLRRHIEESAWLKRIHDHHRDREGAAR